MINLSLMFILDQKSVDLKTKQKCAKNSPTPLVVHKRYYKWTMTQNFHINYRGYCRVMEQRLLRKNNLILVLDKC